ncbi:DNA polymerase III subunit beta [Pseudorhodoplanes sinuspersici]|uniref:DNA polymerase III subunit beta n=1 Tax=Pseudorhodoplanes sinuspersici TaxID=1235591 RepID=UPI0012FD92BF|nr:DNA polymerase III subunit beta [Pseudorhodoplanes sinuspersici]
MAAVIGRTKHGKSVPILAHILLNAEGQKLRLTGNDLQACSIVEMPCEVSEPGAFTIPGDRLNKLVSGLPTGGQIKIEADDKSAKVRAGRSIYTFAGLPAADFPPAFELRDAQEITLTGKQLQRLLKIPAPAISQEQSRPHICGLFLHHEKGRILACATDGHTLIRTSVEVDIPRFDGIIIPDEACSEIVRLAGDGDVTLRVSSTLIEAESGKRRFVSKIVDATFPDYLPVIPQSAPVPFTVEVSDIDEAITRLAAAGEAERAATIRISWERDSDRILISRRTEFGEGNEEIACDCTGRDAGEIAFQSGYVRRLIEASGGKIARLHFDGPGDPARITSPDDADFVSVIMPCRA